MLHHIGRFCHVREQSGIYHKILDARRCSVVSAAAALRVRMIFNLIMQYYNKYDFKFFCVDVKQP